MVHIDRLNEFIEKIKSLDEIRLMTNQDFEKTKESFQDVINSKRKYEKIKSIQELLTILVCRGLTTCINDIGRILNQFLTKEHRNELWNEFRDLENYRSDRKNMYSLTRRQPIVQQRLEYNRIKKFEVMELLDEVMIGREGRPFARSLNRLAELGNEDVLISTDAIQISFDRTEFSDEEKFMLIAEALEKARRNDLARKVREIIKWPANLYENDR